MSESTGSKQQDKTTKAHVKPSRERSKQKQLVAVRGARPAVNDLTEEQGKGDVLGGRTAVRHVSGDVLSLSPISTESRFAYDFSQVRPHTIMTQVESVTRQSNAQVEAGADRKRQYRLSQVLKFKYNFDDIGFFWTKRDAAVEEMLEAYSNRKGVNPDDITALKKGIVRHLVELDRFWGMTEGAEVNRTYKYHIKATFFPGGKGPIEMKLMNPPKRPLEEEKGKLSEDLNKAKESLEKADKALEGFYLLTGNKKVSNLSKSLKKVIKFLKFVECTAEVGEAIGGLIISVEALSELRKKEDGNSAKVQEAYEEMLANCREILLLLCECISPIDREDVRKVIYSALKTIDEALEGVEDLFSVGKSAIERKRKSAGEAGYLLESHKKFYRKKVRGKKGKGTW